MTSYFVSDTCSVVVDRFTKYALYIPTTKKLTAVAFAELFFYHVFRPYGLPDGIVSDRDSLFTSHFWAALCKHLDTKRRMSTAYHPQTDGQTERQNQNLEHYLRAYCNWHQSDWASLLTLAEWTYNNTYHTATGDAPAHLLLGYRPRGPNDVPRASTPRAPAQGAEVDADEVGPGVPGAEAPEPEGRVTGARGEDTPMTDAPEPTGVDDDVTEQHAMPEPVVVASGSPAADDRLKALLEARTRARDILQKSAHAYQHWYNAKRTNKAFAEGDWVLLSTKHLRQRRPSHKIADRYIGPYKITRVMDSQLAYELALPRTMRQHNVFPITSLEPYQGSEEDALAVPRRDDVDESDVAYEVESILAHRGPPNNRRFLVHWKGYPSEEDTWEPLSHLNDGPQLREYLVRMGEEEDNGE